MNIPELIAYSNSNNHSLSGYDNAELISYESLLELPVNVLIPAAKENAITSKNIQHVQAEIIVEGANGPTASEADKTLSENQIQVIPDILANAGGVIVSYFEWLQNTREEKWTMEQVNYNLENILKTSYYHVKSAAEEYQVPLRLAAYIVAVGRVAEKQRILNSLTLKN